MDGSWTEVDGRGAGEVGEEDPDGSDGSRRRSHGKRGEDEDRLWRRWAGEGDEQARESLAELYMPYASSLAAGLFSKAPRGEFPFEEYRQFAMVGLMESIDRYEPGRGAHFKTFALPRIRGAVYNGLERMSERQQQRAFRRRAEPERVDSLVSDRFSSEASPQLLEELESIGVGIALGLILEGVGSRPGVELLQEDAYAQLEMGQLNRQLWEMVDRLTVREREVIVLHYRQFKNFDEIADDLQLTKGRISQLHRQAVSRLRELFSKAATCDVAY